MVVFTHNHELFIKRALESVLSQKTTFEFCLRIHDDASTDTTAQIVNDFLSDSPIPWQLFREAENRYANGISFFHEFIAASSAEFIAILDGDDFWIDDNKLQDQADVLDRFPSTALCHHPVLEFNLGAFTTIDWPPEEYRQDIIPGSKLSAQNVISTSSVVLRTSMLPKTMPPGFNSLRIGDYPMWSLASDGNDIAFIDKAMSAYRIHESNIWGLLQAEERFDRELEARIYISNNVTERHRSLWRAGVVDSVKNYFGFSAVSQTLKDTETELEVRAKELLTAQAELRAARLATQQLLSSASWRFTEPLRKFRVALRRLKRN